MTMVVSELHLAKCWHFFRYEDQLNAIFFVVDLTSYDRNIVFPGGYQPNELDHALEVFHTMLRNNRSTFNVIFTNYDIFEKKIKFDSLKTWKSDFDGSDGDVPAAAKFIEKQFFDLVVNRRQDDDLFVGYRPNVHFYYTNLSNTGQFDAILSDMCDSILRSLLAHSLPM
jgi:hypothetical protein